MTHALGKDIPLGDKYSITIIMSIHKRVNFKASERTSERASERAERSDSPRGPKRNEGWFGEEEGRERGDKLWENPGKRREMKGK